MSSDPIARAAHRGDYPAVLRLARERRGWSQRQLAARLGYSESSVSRWENRKQPMADVELLGRLARALDVPPHLFGLAPIPLTLMSTRHDIEGDDVQRRQFLATAGLSALPTFVPAAPPRRVGSTDVARVHAETEGFGEQQDEYGGGFCREAIAQRVSWAHGLLHADATAGTKIALHRAVGFLTDVAGWGAFDAGRHDEADDYFRFALECAQHGRDWGLRANVLSDMARQALYVGDTAKGLTLIEYAQVRQDLHTPTARAMLATVHARALTAACRHDDALRAIRTAEDHFSGHKPDENPPWIAYYTAAELAADIGWALLPAARDGRHVDQARQCLRRAANAYSASHARARTLTWAQLASLELSVGDAASAADHAQQALAIGAPLHSRRTRDSLSKLRAALD